MSVRVRQLPLAGLREHSENPRRIDDESFEAVQRSLEASPEMLRARPLIALPDGTVIGENMAAARGERTGLVEDPGGDRRP